MSKRMILTILICYCKIIIHISSELCLILNKLLLKAWIFFPYNAKFILIRLLNSKDWLNDKVIT